jgi:surface antigen
MYKLKFFIVALFAIVLAACSLRHIGPPPVTKQQVGTTADASSVISAPVYGAVTGVIPNTLVGKVMDQQDKVNTQQALITTPMGQEAIWTNAHSKTSYIVKPVNEYHSGSSYCRQSQILINNGKKTAYTTICKGPDGKWHVKQ